MNRKEFERSVAGVLRSNNIRKPVSNPKTVFHISDDEGNKKDFIVQKKNKGVLFTEDDISAILDAFMCVVKDALKRGDTVSIRGFGTLGLKYRKARSTKRIDNGEKIDVDARYIPKFTFGNELRMCGKIYELSLGDSIPEEYEEYEDDELDSVEDGD